MIIAKCFTKRSRIATKIFHHPNISLSRKAGPSTLLTTAAAVSRETPHSPLSKPDSPPLPIHQSRSQPYSSCGAIVHAIYTSPNLDLDTSRIFQAIITPRCDAFPDDQTSRAYEEADSYQLHNQYTGRKAPKRLYGSDEAPEHAPFLRILIRYFSHHYRLQPTYPRTRKMALLLDQHGPTEKVR